MLKLKKLTAYATALGVLCGAAPLAAAPVSAENAKTEIVAYYLESKEYDYTVLTGGENNTKYSSTVNGLSGYGAFTYQKVDTASYTYTDVNGIAHPYSLSYSWRAGAGSKTNRCLYFTPKSPCKVTAVFYGSEEIRSMKIEQSGNIYTQAGTGATAAVSMTTTDTTSPVYVYGGSSNKDLYAIIVEYYDVENVTPIEPSEPLLAFPGAEGGGKYTTGARGAASRSVYHVTNLNDKGTGSLRDAVSKPGRVVVFDVGGVIELKSKLSFSAANVTVLGQTAPGDGITLTGYDAEIKADNIILRYLRIRPTDSQGGEPDGLGGRWVHNIVIDHCSLSWSVDELLTLYAGSLESNTNVSKNISVQYCLASESLRMSNHFKGAHGYGGIVGGTEATWHHNLFAHHDSRSPRFDRNLGSTDFVNNVIYDWGNTNSMYGAEPYSYNSKAEFSKPEYASNVNIRNNYMKYGPSTKPSIRSRIFEATNSGSATYNGTMLKSNFYVNGNYVYGDSAATAGNTSDDKYFYNRAKSNILSAPINMNGYEINMETAEKAYETTLATVGASLPKRDEIDARVVADVRNGTGRVINTDEEIGGLVGISSSKQTFAIPSDWKTANEMGSAAETDLAPDGYMWIEKYVNDWTAAQSAPTNPTITVISPAIADISKTYDKINSKGFWTVTKADKAVSYKASAPDAVKIELWDGQTMLRSYDANEIDDSMTLSAGTHYLMSRAYNSKGEHTESPLSIVYVTGVNTLGAVEIGSAPYSGKGSAWTEDGKIYIAGSGLIRNKSDICTFLPYKTNGDFSFACRIENIPKQENNVLAGIMFRESMDANSRMVMLSDLWLKYGENIMITKRTATGENASVDWLVTASGSAIENTSSYETSNYPMPKYMKIERSGSTLTLSVSDSGTNWKDNCRQPVTIDISGWHSEGYIGLAADSVNGDAAASGSNTAHPPLAWFTIASFSDIETSGVDIPAPTEVPTQAPTQAPTEAPTESPTQAPTESPGDETPCVRITAQYNEDGTLRSVSLDEVLLKDAGDAVHTGLTKIFIWDDLFNMRPLK